MPIFCQILGARFNVPASKSMVAPRAMNTFTPGILSRYFIIHFSCLGAPTPTSSTLSTTLVHDANQFFAFIFMLLEAKGRRMSTDHHLATNLLIDMLHSRGSNTTKQENLAVCIILMIHIIRGEEAGTRNRFLNWSLQQLAE